MAQIYDRSELISPSVIRIKFLMPKFWKQGIVWDSTLPDSLNEKFRNDVMK